MLKRICQETGRPFEIADDDLEFLRKISPTFGGKTYLVNPPKLCPEKRLQRRLAYTNQIYLYNRPCSTTGKPIISMFTEDVPFPVIPSDEWWGDSWSAPESKGGYDFNRPFFSQLYELWGGVPFPALLGVRNEDCAYCNNYSDNKSCYLIFNTSEADSCMYCENSTRSRDCIDCTQVKDSELCYDCVLCNRCYNTQSSLCSDDCVDCFFCKDCRSCNDCFGCVNLRRARFCIFNKQYSESEYRQYLQSQDLASHKKRERLKQKIRNFWADYPHPHMIASRCEDSSGNILFEVKDVVDSYIIHRSEDLKYCCYLDSGCKSCRDYSAFGRNAELVYEATRSGINLFNIAFGYYVINGSANLYYCILCADSKDCFGCIGLKKKRYCILNRQYTKEEYQELVPRIIKHMSKTEEWGEFFPISLSPIPYNHSLAQKYFPLSRSEVEEIGCKWYDKPFVEARKYVDPADLPDGLPENDDPIVSKSILSEMPFKITKQEIKICRRLKIPLPRLTYDERMQIRSEEFGDMRLYERMCEKTGKLLQSSYPQEAPYPIWDRDLYEKEFGS